MNCLRFELVKFIDCCLSSVTTCKTSCLSAFRAVFKDTRKRSHIFVYSNLFLCTLNGIVFTIKNSGGIKKYTEPTNRWLFIAVTSLAWMMAIFLLYAFKRRKYVLCRVWCFVETFVILMYLLLALSESVHFTWPGWCLLTVSVVMELYGLWVVYYYSLEVKNWSDDHHKDCNIPEDGLNIKYFVTPTKPAIKRRETDQTSIDSSPPSLTKYDDDENEECNDSVLDDNSPTEGSFKFYGPSGDGLFDLEPQYSEIMIQGHTNCNSVAVSPPLTSVLSDQKDNIIISDLMCGGSSTLYVESNVGR